MKNTNLNIYMNMIIYSFIFDNPRAVVCLVRSINARVNVTREKFNVIERV